MGERADLRRQRKLSKEAKARLDNAVRAMLQHPDTRAYLIWLLEIGKVGTQPFSQNALLTSFQCGELNVGQQIFAHILEVDTAGYVQMMKEKDYDAGIVRGPDADTAPDDDDRIDA